jgi:hypothetical protein
MTPIDPEELAADAAAVPTADKIARLQEGLRELRDKEDALKTLNQQAATLKMEIEDLAYRRLVDQFLDLHFDHQTVDAEGNYPQMLAELKHKVVTKIPEANQARAYAYLEEKGFGDNLQRTIAINLGRNSEQEAAGIRALLESNSNIVREYVETKGINYQTLQKIGRDLHARGDLVPTEQLDPKQLLGIWIGHYIKLSEG